MQFVANGPDIPDALLQAHEEGRVVFFCGAGISYPAGLPGFRGLVEEICELVGTTFTDIERDAFERGQYDVTLDLLERRLPGQRFDVRRALVKSLKPKLRRKGAVDTQTALLHLARSREGTLRLVTTNFDCVFHVAAKRMGKAFQAYAAPMLPVPKSSRWNGLVYLHGLLSEEINDKVDETALNRLVLTSGDFGLAYLVERWAARFVSELFRNYVVCFVGYSINDPVLRYMMDALAADRMLGEVTPQAWALGDCDQGREREKAIEWEAKGVIPVLYNVPTGSNDHSMLHKTLHAWADIYRDGVLGKEAIVARHAGFNPQVSTQSDNFLGRMLWALSDKSGLPAKRFAEFSPVPPLDWLFEVFEKEYFTYDDLVRFDVQPRAESDAKLRFSLIHRPAPYDKAPFMSLFLGAGISSQLDHGMVYLAHWLVRHLNDARLLIWIAERGGRLHDYLIGLIKRELDRFTLLEREGRTSELDGIRSHAPMSIPTPPMRVLWHLLLCGRIKSSRYIPDLYHWQKRLKQEGLSITLRLELREMLAPKIALKKPFSWNEVNTGADEPTRIRYLVDWELMLAANHVHSALNDLSQDYWVAALPLLFEDLQQLLHDALDLLGELGEADELSDRSHWYLPSITPHRQNWDFRSWVKLIELLREAWMAVRTSDSARAARIAHAWFELPYPSFKRLALFAASQDDCIAPEQWVDWLLADEAWWLWSIETKREMFRLIVLQGEKLTGEAQDRLEAAILIGPPRKMYIDNLEQDQWQERVDNSVWLHLAKLRASGIVLGASAKDRLDVLSKANSTWQLMANERDEFSAWMDSSDDPDFESSRYTDVVPRKRSDIVQWLKKPTTENRPFYEDTWDEICRTRFFHSWLALRDLAQDGLWPLDRWRTALFVWSEEGRVLHSWKYAAPLVLTMPDGVLQETAHAVSNWIESVSKLGNHHAGILLELCRRTLALSFESSVDAGIFRNSVEIDDPVFLAINHPIGKATQALINLWFKQNSNDNDLLLADIKSVFTNLCNPQVDRFRHGRVLLGTRLIAFFRVQRPWTEQYLLPLFAWSNPVEAKAVWSGFLLYARLYQLLLMAFKVSFLDCATHYDDLGEQKQRFVTFLTYAALEQIEGYTVVEFRAAIGKLPPTGLEKLAEVLWHALESAADQREDYWKNRVQPFWQLVWPKSGDLATQEISESLVQLAIAARGEFSAALTSVRAWLRPIEHPYYVVAKLHESGLCKKFPEDVLRLLEAVIDPQRGLPSELGKCLDEIVQTAPQLDQDDSYRRLREYCRKHDI